MIIQLNEQITESAKQDVLDKINDIGYKPREIKTFANSYIVAIGKKEFDIRKLGNLPGVKDVHIVSDDYQFVSRKWKVNATTIDLGDGVKIGENDFAIMAGPCSIESEEQVYKVTKHLSENGVKIMRGGAFKPRSSPYAFRGLGIPGLKMWYDITRQFGIKIITEVMEASQIEQMYDYVDIYQVGARNTQNFNLLDELGKVDKPVMIKRGISGTIEELLSSAEYVFSGGNEKILLCERGIRSFEKAYRNTLDLNAVPILKEKSHLPVIVDPSHGIGIRDYVDTMSLAAVMSGADGVIVEIHEKPEEALSDSQQTLNFNESQALIRKLNATVSLRNTF
jgi:3-deoxy-7-phosphoheptulonate synthase